MKLFLVKYVRNFLFFVNTRKLGRARLNVLENDFFKNGQKNKGPDCDRAKLFNFCRQCSREILARSWDADGLALCCEHHRLNHEIRIVQEGLEAS